MMWRAELCTPREALDVGLIDELVPAGAPVSALDRALEVASDIAARPALAVAHIKRLARASVSPVTKDQLDLESKLFAELMRTDEAKRLLAEVAEVHRNQRESASR
jgi:enoyl-CoA hydratase/carnithine racemase